ncbi:MAG: hypothetical protein ACRDD8_06020 [Bacteroidales bacterium]
MRQDISVDLNTGEIDMIFTQKMTDVGFNWDHEDDFFVYGTVFSVFAIPKDGLLSGLIVSIPQRFPVKNIKIRIIDRHSPIPCVSDEYLIVERDNGDPLKASELPLVSDMFVFRLFKSDNKYTLTSAIDFDLCVEKVAKQNELFLLRCDSGNLYNHPTSGVGITKYLNGNIASSQLGNKIKNEFRSDNISVTKALVVAETGQIYIETEELNV